MHAHLLTLSHPYILVNNYCTLITFLWPIGLAERPYLPSSLTVELIDQLTCWLTYSLTRSPSTHPCDLIHLIQADHPLRLTECLSAPPFLAHSLAHSLTDSFSTPANLFPSLSPALPLSHTHSPTPFLPHSCTHVFTQSLAHSLTLSFSHSLTNRFRHPFTHPCILVHLLQVDHTPLPLEGTRNVVPFFLPHSLADSLADTLINVLSVLLAHPLTHLCIFIHLLQVDHISVPLKSS